MSVHHIDMGKIRAAVRDGADLTRKICEITRENRGRNQNHISLPPLLKICPSAFGEKAGKGWRIVQIHLVILQQFTAKVN